MEVVLRLGRGWFPTLYGDPRAGSQHLEQVEQRLGELAPDVRALAVTTLDLTRYWRGDGPLRDEGELSDERLLPYVALGHESWVALEHRGLAGDYEVGISEAEARIAELIGMGDVVWCSRLENTLGWVHSEILDLGRARELNDASIARISTLEPVDVEVISHARLNNVDLHLLVGDVEKAAELLDVVGESRVDPESDFARWRWELRYLTATAQLALAEGRLDDADRWITELHQMADETLALKRVVVADRLRAELSLQLGQMAEASQQAEGAVASAETLGSPYQRWQSLHLAHRCASALGDGEAASGYLDRYRKVVASVADSLSSERATHFLSDVPKPIE